MSEFHDAAEAGNLDELKRLYESYEEVEGEKFYNHSLDDTDHSGRTVFSFLVRHRHTAVLRAFIFYINKHGREFHDAAISGDLEKLISLQQREYKVEKDDLSLFSLEQKDEEGKTVFHHLVENGHSKALKGFVEHLKEKKIFNAGYFTQADRNRKTPVQYALDNKDIDTLYLFQESKVKFKSTEKDRLETILLNETHDEFHQAAIDGNLDRITELYGWKFTVSGNPFRLFTLDKRNSEGKTIFHLLAENGHSDILNQLLYFLAEKQPDHFQHLETTDNDGKNVLHLAVERNDAGIAYAALSNNYELRSGDDPSEVRAVRHDGRRRRLLEQKDSSGIRPLDLMFNSSQYKTSNTDPNTALTLDNLNVLTPQICARKDYQKALYLIAAGISYEDFSTRFLAGLLLYVKSKNYSVFYSEILSELYHRPYVEFFTYKVDETNRIIDIILTDETLFKSFWTMTLYEYFAPDDTKLRKLVFDKDVVFIPFENSSEKGVQDGANRYYRDVDRRYLNEMREHKEGNYLLHVLAKTNNIELIRYLKNNKKLKFFLFNKKGETPFEVALRAGHLQAAELLIGKNIDAQSKGINGYTLLHIAALRKDLQAVKFLKGKGAKLDIKNNKKKTPFDLAFNLGYEEIAIELLSETNKKSGVFRRSLSYQARNKGMNVLADFIKRQEDYDKNTRFRERVKTFFVAMCIALLAGLTTAAMMAIGVGLVKFWPLLLCSSLVTFGMSLFVIGVRQLPSLAAGITFLALSSTMIAFAGLVSGGVMPSLVALLSLPVQLTWDAFMMSGLVGFFTPFVLYLGTWNNFRYPSPIGLHVEVISESKKLNKDEDEVENDDESDDLTLDNDRVSREVREADGVDLNTLATMLSFGAQQEKRGATKDPATDDLNKQNTATTTPGP